MSKELTAEMARQLVAKSQKRNNTIQKLIDDTNESIAYACKNGERQSVLHDTTKWYGDIYIEVHEHFKELGYEIKQYRDGSGFYLTW